MFPRLRSLVLVSLLGASAAVVGLSLGPARAAPVDSALEVNERLGPGNSLASGQYRLTMETSGNLVVYGPGGPLWATYTDSPNASLVNEPNGDLVIYRSDNAGVVWSSRTSGRGAGRLLVQADGDIVKFGPTGVVWSTYTAGGASQMKASGAVAFARAQVGKRYLFGASGPSAFDEPGLTMMSYHSVQVALPRTARDQWQLGTAVSRDALRPGDLVFRYSGVVVAIYVGLDEIIYFAKDGRFVSGQGSYVSFAPIFPSASITGYRRHV